MKAIFHILLLFLVCASSQSLPPLQLRGQQFYSGNRPFSFNGLNWFGFNNKQTMVDGLWAGGTSAGTDFSTIVESIRLLGYNSVRLPFVFSDLQMNTMDKTHPCRVISDADVISRCRVPKPPYPLYKSLPRPDRGRCNAYLPRGKTEDRFLWVMKKFIENNMYVVIDYHDMGVEQIARHPKAFVEAWRSLWLKITTMPDFHTKISGRVLIDILNEPDSMKLSWSHMGDLYLRTMDALYPIGNNTAWFLVEGTGQTNYYMNWGDGFVTDPKVLATHQLSDPNPFFKRLLDKPYRHRVIISPHVYGPSISFAKLAYSGQDMFRRLNSSFGYLYQKGFCDGKKCMKFPIIVGEFGSKFEDPRDLIHLQDFSKWMKETFKNPSWLYWAYNQNSGDTGGIVKNNWQDIDWRKVLWLRKNMI
jgi:hypothetical protein